MGYFIGDLFDSVIKDSESDDFWEMFVHHTLTITLYGGLIMQNQMRIGLIVSFIHNVTDILAGVTRGFSQTRFSTATVVTFLSCVVVWMYFRNFALPIVTFACWTLADYSLELDQYYLLHYILSSFLTVLCVMHIYWTSLFLKMIYTFAFTSSTENIINPVTKSKATTKT